jgi:hypothetical protein
LSRKLNKVWTQQNLEARKSIISPSSRWKCRWLLQQWEVGEMRSYKMQDPLM